MHAIGDPKVFLFLSLSLSLCLATVNFERVRRLRELEENRTRNIRRSTTPIGNPKFIPGEKARGFVVKTLRGTLKYPGPELNETLPILFHSFNWESAFLRCLWNCTGSLEGLVGYSPENVHYIFMSRSVKTYFDDALWMRNRVAEVAERLLGKRGSERLLARCHFVTEPAVPGLNGEFWVPDMLEEWSCEDHNCGIDQVVFASVDKFIRMTLPRLDARYDWLPSPERILGDQSYGVTYAGSGCEPVPEVNGSVALVDWGSCSYFQKVNSMEASGAKAILVMQKERDGDFEDMNCSNEEECSCDLRIPATMVPRVDVRHFRNKFMTVRYLNKRSENFFAGIDWEGSLSEFGWLLHPSFRYVNWQADWFDYKRELNTRLSQEAETLVIFNDESIMRGEAGVAINYTFVNASALKAFNTLELEAGLSCQGHMDAECPHWDRTIQLFMACGGGGASGEVEVGRWISPFRRRIGKWLTEVTPLLALLPEEDQTTCTFRFTGALGGEFWMPRLSLRLSNSDVTDMRPVSIFSWISGTFDFNKNYNSLFKPFKFYSDDSYRAVKIYSVITGHGSDENGCGEFCITSHHFVINGEHLYNETFFNAGAPLGCAERTRSGVEPNEHGTWLYGRNGWCDGQQVDPWIIDITHVIHPRPQPSSKPPSKVNTIEYFGLFRGEEPNPVRPGAVMTIQAFVVFYK